MLEQAIDKILSAFDCKGIAVAVSGGADSMALALLSHKWAKKHKVNFIALTVDHRLRSTSTAEAFQVSTWLSSHGINTRILTLDNLTKGGNIQNKARNARYDAMAKFCQEQDIPILLVGHHRDDQWETIMQRLSRGSSYVGLRGISSEFQLTPTLKLIRPFLAYSKEELIGYLNKEGQSFVKDPSNKNEKFERVRWRQNKEFYETLGYNDKNISHIIEESKKIFDLLNRKVSFWEEKYVEKSPWGYLCFSHKEWNNFPPVCQLHFLRKWTFFFRFLTGRRESLYSLPQKNLKICQEALAKGSKDFSQGGLRALFRNGKVYFLRETRFLPSFTIKSQNIYWDRFHLSYLSPHLMGLPLGPLPPEKYKESKEKLKEKGVLLPSAVIETLPWTPRGLVHLEEDINIRFFTSLKNLWLFD